MKSKIPEIVSDYVRIYKPQPGVYIGENTGNYRKGSTYKDWKPNDHTFIKGPDNRWHCFGITRPNDVKNDGVHEGEGTCFHAVAPTGTLEQAFAPEVWKDKPKLDVSGCGWAPVCVKVGDTYSIIGSEVRQAVSKDLNEWKDKGKMAIKGDGRDPNIMFWNGTYYLVRCNGPATLVTSTDFEHWSDPVTICQPAMGGWCESPTLLRHGKMFYLFICPWDGDRNNPYSHQTYVYASDTPTNFNNRAPIAQLKAHAPEIIQDEKGDWFISSADYPEQGINLARLTWKPQPAPAPAFVTLDGKPSEEGNPIGQDGYIHRVDKPILHLIRTADAEAKGTIMLCPGGSYEILGVSLEGILPTAHFLNKQGFDVDILEYTIASGPATRDRALGDAIAAWRLIKGDTQALGLHGGRFGLMGFSAGGHLAARLTARLSAAEQPDDVLLIYPAYLDETTPGTHVPFVTPPLNPSARLFALIAANDHANWVSSCRDYAEVWKKNGGTARLEILKDGAHGFGIRLPLHGDAKRWPELLADFLRTSQAKVHLKEVVK